MKKSAQNYKHKIAMLIDDNNLDRLVNQRILEVNNFAEIIYENSSTMSAIEFLKKLEISSDENAQLFPDCIFVDLNMPLNDGFQFIDMFYNQFKHNYKSCKLFVLTSSLNPNDKVRVHKVDSSIPFINKSLTQDILASLL